jgi:hypothetical protein
MRAYVLLAICAIGCGSSKGGSDGGGGSGGGAHPVPIGGPGSVSAQAACGVAGQGTIKAGDGSVLTPDKKYTLQLTGSGDKPALLAPVTDAREPSESGLVPSFTVTAPSGACPHLMGRVSPAVAIPHGSSIRAIEGYFAGQRLALDPVHDESPDSELLEEAHNFGPQMMPFNTPLYSLDGIAAGKGTLEIRAYDADYKQVAVWSLPDLEVVAPPKPIATSDIAGFAHPRVILTAKRLENATAKLAANDTQAQRFTKQLNRFLSALDKNPDPTSSAFEDAIYNPAGFMPMLGVCYQLYKSSDAAKAKKCGDAARALAVKIANDYNGSDATQKFGRDTGYDLRDQELWMLLALDWIHDVLSADDRKLLVKVTTAWANWYTSDANGPYSRGRPINNYYSPYIQALMLTGIATAGESDQADAQLQTLRKSLSTILPVANQRVCGGDWPEGGNYGPNALRAHMMVLIGMADIGEDWSRAFDFVQPIGLVSRYQITGDYTQMLPFGGFSGLMPHKTSPALLAMLTPTTAGGTHAGTLYNQIAATPKNDFFDSSDGDTAFELLFGDVSANAAVTDLPLACYSPGSGRFFSKSSLADSGAYLMTAEDMHYFFDHFGYANGDVRFYHGGTCLVCPSTYRGPAFGGEGGTASFSTYQVNGKTQKQDRNNQVLFARDAADYSVIAMRFESAFVSDRFDESIFDPANPLDYLIREAVHVRPDVLVVRDLSRRRHDADTLVGRFHLGPKDAPQGSGSKYTVGALSISMGGTSAPTVAFSDDADQDGNVVGKQMTQTFAASTTELDSVTVFSDTGVTLDSYSGGVAKLSNGKCVTFANGDVKVASCS